MGAVEAEPPRAIIAALAAVGIVFSEGQAAVHGGAGLDRVVVAAVPGMAGGDADVPAAVADAVIRDFPLEALMDAAGEQDFRVLSGDRVTHGVPSVELGCSFAPVRVSGGGTNLSRAPPASSPGPDAPARRGRCAPRA